MIFFGLEMPTPPPFWTFFPKYTTKIYHFKYKKICNVIFGIENYPPFDFWEWEGRLGVVGVKKILTNRMIERYNNTHHTHKLCSVFGSPLPMVDRRSKFKTNSILYIYEVILNCKLLSEIQLYLIHDSCL